MTEHFEEHHDKTMEALVRALETAPAVDVPADFAARVMARVPETSRSAVSLKRARALTPRYGRTAAFGATGVVLVAMLLMARLPGVTSVWSSLQIVMLVQLCAYTLWIGLASWRRQ